MDPCGCVTLRFSEFKPVESGCVSIGMSNFLAASTLQS